MLIVLFPCDFPRINLATLCWRDEMVSKSLVVSRSAWSAYQNNINNIGHNVEPTS